MLVVSEQGRRPYSALTLAYVFIGGQSSSRGTATSRTRGAAPVPVTSDGMASGRATCSRTWAVPILRLRTSARFLTAATRPRCQQDNPPASDPERHTSFEAPGPACDESPSQAPRPSPEHHPGHRRRRRGSCPRRRRRRPLKKGATRRAPPGGSRGSRQHRAHVFHVPEAGQGHVGLSFAPLPRRGPAQVADLTEHEQAAARVAGHAAETSRHRLLPHHQQGSQTLVGARGCRRCI